jgi:CDP-diacylglycerol--serine O-phosphatidyltransferase
LVLLGAGALFDGLDGAAARRWGGSRFGVLADDVADGVSYGVAPAVAISSVLGGVQGLVLGVAFASFVVARLLFFTLNKGQADPRYFAGVPSTIGGLMVLCSLLLFGNSPALIGFMIGVACAQMVAFANPHRHLGRYLREHPRAFRIAPLIVIAITATGVLRGPGAAAGLVLTVSAGYAVWPSAKRFAQVLKASAQDRSVKAEPRPISGGAS